MTIVCGRSSRQYCKDCGRPATKLCDYPLSGDKAGQTCDRPMCESHSVRQGPEVDFCLAHDRAKNQIGNPRGGVGLIGKHFRVVEGFHQGHVMHILAYRLVPRGNGRHGKVWKYASFCSCAKRGELEHQHLKYLDLSQEVIPTSA